MPPHPKRDRCVILYDLNCKSQEKNFRALLKIYSHYYFRSSKDLVNLVLVNCEKTKNILNQQNGKGYENIYMVNREELPYDPVFAYNAVKENNSGCASWKEALRVALEILKQDNLPRIITYKILYLSDLSVSSQSDEKIDYIIEQINYYGIFLYIVGPQVKFPKTISSFDELKSLKQDIIFEDTNNNLMEAKEAVINCDNAVIANIIVGIQLFFKYCNPIGKQPWTVPLSIGSKIQYNVETSKLMEKVKGFALKKNNEVRKSLVFIDSKDSTKEYAEEDVRKGIFKHGKFVPLASNDMFKEKLDRMFSLLFITKTKSIPEYMMKGPQCYSVVSSSKHSSAAFDTLLLQLNESESSLIVRRVYSKGNNPVYLALIPLPSKKCFRAIQLPYGHQILFEFWEQENPKDEKISTEISEYLERLTVGSENFSLQCQMMPNVVVSSRGESLVNMATEKLLGVPDLHLEEVTLDPFMTGISSEIGKNLRDRWPSRGPPAQIEKKDEDSSDEDDADINLKYF